MASLPRGLGLIQNGKLRSATLSRPTSTVNHKELIKTLELLSVDSAGNVTSEQVRAALDSLTKDITESVNIQELLDKVTKIAKEGVVHPPKENYPNTFLLITDLLGHVAHTWFDADSYLYLLLSESKRWGLLGALATSYLLGVYVGTQNMKIGEQLLSPDEVPKDKIVSVLNGLGFGHE